MAPSKISAAADGVDQALISAIVAPAATSSRKVVRTAIAPSGALAIRRSPAAAASAPICARLPRSAGAGISASGGAACSTSPVDIAARGNSTSAARSACYASTAGALSTGTPASTARDQRCAAHNDCAVAACRAIAVRDGHTTSPHSNGQYRAFGQDERLLHHCASTSAASERVI